MEEFAVPLPFSITVFGGGDEQLKEPHENIRDKGGVSVPYCNRILDIS
jgi:hypothetical protein